MTISQGYELPTERPLKAYAFDPSQGRNLGNLRILYNPKKPCQPAPGSQAASQVGQVVQHAQVATPPAGGVACRTPLACSRA